MSGTDDFEIYPVMMCLFTGPLPPLVSKLSALILRCIRHTTLQVAYCSKYPCHVTQVQENMHT